RERRRSPPLTRPTRIANRSLQRETFGHLARPVSVAIRPAQRNRLPNLCKFIVRERVVGDSEPVRWYRHRPSRKERIAVIATMPSARPAPFFNSASQQRADRIASDVASDGQEVMIALYRNRFESSLVEGPGAGRAARGVPALCLRASEPLHELREL